MSSPSDRKKFPDTEENSHIKPNKSSFLNDEEDKKSRTDQLTAVETVNSKHVTVMEMPNSKHVMVVEMSSFEHEVEGDELDLEFPDYLEELKNDIMQNVLATSSLKITSQDRDSTENICRICYDDSNDVIRPPSTMCKCRGSVGLVHVHCLEKWLNEKTIDTCELCHHRFDTQFEPTQRSICRSMVRFVFLSDATRGFQAPNCLAFITQALVLGFMLISFNLFAMSLVHVLAAQNQSDPFYTRYSSNLCLVLLVVLINWLFSTLLIKDTWVQYWIWYTWWLKTFTVKLVVPSKAIDTTSVSS